jgi:hypothetical protein
LSIVADSVILGTLSSKFGEQLPGANQNILDALTFLHASYENLEGSQKGSFVWQQAKDQFVETFSRLAMKSQT